MSRSGVQTWPKLLIENLAYASVIETYRQTLPEHIRTLFNHFHCRVLAIKVVGVDSVGTM
ncbi:DUF2252 family protein [Zwartia sp.]|uniref:DUF2252 family protein n=1 Tax=Zwartia sp. TaxID=2978004 RepID=UPI003BB1636E